MPLICEMVVNSVCAFRGQVFVGGFVEPWHDAGLEHVGWSRIGHAEFTLEKDNTSGYMRMPKGNCLKVLPMQTGVIGYAEQSVAAFFPVDQPAVTFGMQEVFPKTGIAGRDAVAGDGRSHFFLDNTGTLWGISHEFQPQKIGYKDIFEEFLDEKIFMSYVSARNELYISAEYAAFVLGEGGLYEINQLASNVNLKGKELIGGYENLDYDYPLEVETDILDFGMSGIKTVTSVEIAGSLPEKCWMSAWWRNNKSQGFKPSPWRPVSPLGISHLQVSGNELKLRLRGNSVEDVELDYLNVKFQTSDKRNVRGAYAGQTET